MHFRLETGITRFSAVGQLKRKALLNFTRIVWRTGWAVNFYITDCSTLLHSIVILLLDQLIYLIYNLISQHAYPFYVLIMYLLHLADSLLCIYQFRPVARPITGAICLLLYFRQPLLCLTLLVIQ